MKIERIWAKPSKWTFTIAPIKKLIEEECNGRNWIDPFAGETSPAEYTNDWNPRSQAGYHMDAWQWLQSLPDNTYDGALYDPPYSFRQAKECYESYGAHLLKKNLTSNMEYWANCKDNLARVLKPGGKVICCGWTSQGLGINRGFTMTRILLVPHGGSRNDTIVTVEIKN